MDPRVGPSRIPFVEVALCVLDAFEAQPLERRALRVADAGLDLALSVRIPDTTRQRDDAVVTENVAVQRIELRVVDVRLEYALAQIVEHDGRRRAAQTTKRLLVELGPDPHARRPHEKPHGLAAEAERQHEQARAPV